jgi:hypothetical protein
MPAKPASTKAPVAKKAAKAWVPESVLKKRAKQEEIQKKKNVALAEQRLKNKKTRGIIFKKALAYDKEYKAAERDTVRMRREAKKQGNFFMEPEPKLVLVVRIKGINGVDPKTRKILQLMRLKQVSIVNLMFSLDTSIVSVSIDWILCCIAECKYFLNSSCGLRLRCVSSFCYFYVSDLLIYRSTTPFSSG